MVTLCLAFNKRARVDKSKSESRRYEVFFFLTWMFRWLARSFHWKLHEVADCHVDRERWESWAHSHFQIVSLVMSQHCPDGPWRCTLHSDHATLKTGWLLQFEFPTPRTVSIVTVPPRVCVIFVFSKQVLVCGENLHQYSPFISVSSTGSKYLSIAAVVTSESVFRMKADEIRENLSSAVLRIICIYLSPPSSVTAK